MIVNSRKPLPSDNMLWLGPSGQSLTKDRWTFSSRNPKYRPLVNYGGGYHYKAIPLFLVNNGTFLSEVLEAVGGPAAGDIWLLEKVV